MVIIMHAGICSREVGDEDEDSAPLMILEYMQHAFLQSHRFILAVKHYHSLGLNEVLLHRFAGDVRQYVRVYLTFSSVVSC